MMKLYKQIRELNNQNAHLLGTIMNGPYIGEKALWSDMNLVYTSKDHIPWPSKELIESIYPSCKIIEVNGYKIFLESLMQEKKLVICGGGHISMPLIIIGKQLGFKVTVLEDRPLFANHARKAGADTVICNSFITGLSEVKSDQNTFFIIVTRGHKYDSDCLRNIILKENAYIGMIGSKLRARNVMQELLEEGFSEERLEQVYTPVGLKINAETPEEIAVAIMAEVINVKNASHKKSGFTKEILDGLLNEEHASMPKALVTIISKLGSAPRGVSTRMLVYKDKTTIGTIGGGCVESTLINNAIKSIESNQVFIVEKDLTGDYAEENGMVCGGIVKLLIEPLV